MRPFRVVTLSPFEYGSLTTSLVILRSLSRAYSRRGVDAVAAAFGARGGCADGIRLLAGARGLEGLLRPGDLVHVHFPGEWDGAFAEVSSACRRLGADLGATFQDRRNPDQRGETAAERGRLERFLAGCRWVTAASRFSADRVGSDFPDWAGRVQVVPNGHDLEPVSAGAREAEGDFVLCAARLAPYKGVDVLLMAWKDVCETFDGVELVFCGQDHGAGYYQDLARSLGIAGRVRFLPWQSRRRLSELMRGCRFFVLPSRHEAFGMAAVEAMGSGKAVLASRVGGLREIVDDGKTGLLVPPADVGALARALGGMLRSPGRCAAMGSRGRRAAERFSWRAAADAYLRVHAGGDRISRIAASAGRSASGAGAVCGAAFA